jgi:carbamoyltransferase
MLIVAPIKESRRCKMPEGYNNMPLLQRLYVHRSDLPAITHIDFSARVQTIHQETNPRYWQLLDTFKQQTGYSVMVNTSFNVRGEPPVCTPEDAYKCFMRTEMDYLVIGNYLLTKTEQPEWPEKDDWKKEFTLD